jgi:branched-chain amino acid transport system ATP-binding protein
VNEAPLAVESFAGPVALRGQALEVQGVVKSFGGLRAVNGATFKVAEGSITALIGPNGAGKTTLFNVVTGFYSADSGQARYGDRQILGRSPNVLTRLGMVRTFQLTKALSRMSVLDNMMLAAPEQPGEHLTKLLLGLRRVRIREREVRAAANELLDLFKLQPLAGEYAGTLSGGQRKLLELARALMTRPSMLLLDEPMAGVNPTLGRELLAHIQALRTEYGLTVLFIEHDMDAVMTHADSVIVMADGRVICDGTPAEVCANQTVIDAYLGGSPVEPLGVESREVAQ